MESIRAVITGDIIGSTGITGNYKERLRQIADDVRQFQDERFIMDIYRGDSFQTISNRPEKGLLLLLIIKAGLNRYSSKEEGKKYQWDARMSLGIGQLEQYPTNNEIGELSGEPFIKSGRALDQMKDKGQLIVVTTGKEDMDKELSSVCPLIEAITSRWTKAQADAIYLSLLHGMITQQEIGRKLGKSQRAIGKSLEASDIEAIKTYLKRFEKLIQWNFNT